MFRTPSGSTIPDLDPAERCLLEDRRLGKKGGKGNLQVGGAVFPETTPPLYFPCKVYPWNSLLWLPFTVQLSPFVSFLVRFVYG